jgi:membrane-associated phospholipid phosphatase
VARSLNHLGSANLLAAVLVVLAVPLIARTRSARPLLPILVTYGLSHSVIAPIKILSDRAAPHNPAPDAVELFADPSGWSYPSGHMANTLIWYPLLVAFLDANLRALGRADLSPAVHRTLLVAPPVIVAITLTYLGFHWVTDSVAAVLIGVLLLRLLRRIPWAALQPAPAPAAPAATRGG